jgi:DNA-binding response OmpR family regulator
LINGDTQMTAPAPKLLLVEDYADLAETTAEFLRQEGFEVRVVLTGREAIQTASTFLPEIVLCDISLPDMSGFDVVKELRAHPETEQALLAIHSGITESDIGLSERELRTMHVDLFLTKPLTMEKVETLRSRSKKRRRGH